MEIKKQLITPARAQELLQANLNNRQVRTKTVAKYANEMINGRWKEDTFELIKISKTGIILDGQHRLLAVVKSKMPIYFHLVENVEDSVFDVLDTGSVRNASDVFHINKIKYSTATPAIISFYFYLKNNAQKGGNKTNSELLAIYNESPIEWDFISKTATEFYKAFGKVLSASQIGGMLYFLMKIDKDDALNFMEQVCRGKNIQLDVINILRNRLVLEKVSVNKLTTQTKMAYIIKSWNYYRRNTDAKILKFTPSTDAFPKAI